MVPYNKDREPSLWQWVGSSIQASLTLDQQVNVTYTNLDEISGSVILRCAKAVNITSIVVKLEGESRTRLLGQRLHSSTSNDTKQVLEYYKILYKTLDVFPPAHATAARNGSKGSFTLAAGTHEYPWKFKIPFNNACSTQQTAIPGLNFGMSSQGLEVTREPTRHVKKTLPPTLTGFPGEAEISYFVKATIARSGLLKENPRAFVPFNFLQIEPPRQAPTGAQVYARQRHDFTSSAISKKNKMKSIFGGSTTTSSGNAPSVSVDIRLPQPAVITCNQVLPLSIMVKKLNSTQGIVSLQSLQVALIGFTKVTAHEFQRIEQNSWVIVSKSNMQMPLGSASDPEGTEVAIDSSLWQSSTLPPSVAPSFETCNIARYYQVDVRIGLSFGGSLMGAQPQTIILPMRLDTLVYSGIAPPAEVIVRMAERGRAAAHTQQPIVAPGSETGLGNIGDSKPPLSVAEQARPAIAPTGPADFEDAPPSYEDATANDLPPIDGYRPEYAPPPAERDALLHADEKR